MAARLKVRELFSEVCSLIKALDDYERRSEMEQGDQKHGVGYCDHCGRPVERGGDRVRSLVDGNEFTT
jgi:hypothetical protein